MVKSGGIPTGGEGGGSVWKRTEKPTRPQLTAADANLKAPIVTFDPRVIQGMRGQKSRDILCISTKHGTEIPRRRAGKFFWSFFSAEDSKRASIRTCLDRGRSENSHYSRSSRSSWVGRDERVGHKTEDPGGVARVCDASPSPSSSA